MRNLLAVLTLKSKSYHVKTANHVESLVWMLKKIVKFPKI